jgi:hypothetical protein
MRCLRSRGSGAKLAAAGGANTVTYVRDVSKSVAQVVTKDETFEMAKAIILLSHHLAFVSCNGRK